MPRLNQGDQGQPNLPPQHLRTPEPTRHGPLDKYSSQFPRQSSPFPVLSTSPIDPFTSFTPLNLPPQHLRTPEPTRHRPFDEYSSQLPRQSSPLPVLATSPVNPFTSCEEEFTAYNPNVLFTPFRFNQWKLQRIADLLDSFKWSFSMFLTHWLQMYPNDDLNFKLRQQWISTPDQRQRLFCRAIESPVIKPIASLATAYIVQAELDLLIQTPFFGIFDPSDIPLTDTTDFTAAYQSIEKTAPTWSSWAAILLPNQREHRPSYDAEPDKNIPKRLFMITSMICHSRAARRSNYLCSLLDCYLLGSGVKRRSLQVLSGLGICHSYSTCNRLLEEVRKKARVFLP